MIFNPEDLYGTKLDFMNGVLQNAERRGLPPDLLLPAAAKGPMAPDMRRRELDVVQLNPQSALLIADVIAGGAAATPMMGRASLEASRALRFDQGKAISGGPLSKLTRAAEKAE